jgi:hypothetical protein
MTMLRSVVASGAGNSSRGNFNEYADALMPLSTPAIIYSYTVPTSKTLSIFQLIGWGDVDAEYLVKVDGVTKAGGRSSPSDRTMDLYFSAPISATAAQLVQIFGEQNYAASKVLKINIMGELK